MEKKATIKEIKYGGFTETPSDYECPDGDLATVSGLVPEDEALCPVQQPRREFTLPPNSGADYWTVVYIHQNTGYKHYIVRHHTEVTENNDTTITNTFYWMDKPPVGTVFVDSVTPGEGETTFDTTKLLQSFEGLEIYQVNATGNALMILTDEGMYYYLWKNDAYKALGNHMPEPQLSFGLQGEADMTETTFEVRIDGSTADAEQAAHGGGSNPPIQNYTIITNNYAKAMTEGVMAAVNSYIAQKSVESGKFIFPFLVRYAYRLFDESLVMQSCPVLMITDTYCSPHVKLHSFSGWTTFEGLFGSMLYDLDYLATTPDNVSFSDFVGDWKEIIKSVDVFISEPIYTFDQSGKVSGWGMYLPSLCGYGVFNIPDPSKTYHRGVNASDMKTDAYSRYNVDRLIFGALDSDTSQRLYTMPLFSEDHMKQKISDIHNFYLLKSIPINEVVTDSRTKLKLPEKFLNNMTGYEVMTDDYDSHDLLIPRYSFTYNSRLTIANISRKISNPFRPDSMVCHTYRSMANLTDYEDVDNADYSIYIYLDMGIEEIVIKGSASEMGFHNPFLYFYYPNPNAYKVIIDKRYTENGGPVRKLYELPLKKHDFLNGAVYFEGWSHDPDEVLHAAGVTSNNIIEMPNKIYTSEVNNPFYFPSEGMRTIGIGTILGIRPAVKAVSPSQYGQYNFYVFTTECNYVLKVSDTGYPEKPDPLPADIVNGLGESITQIDGSVLFATGRGIMMTSGSTTICMSDILNSKQPFVPFGATADKDVLPGLRNIVPAGILASVQPVRFLDYIRDCRMVYDYTHQRILIFNPAQPYAYVYSLKSKQWGMIPSAMQQPVLDYPSATVMVKIIETVSVGGVNTTIERWTLYDFSEEVEASAGSKESAVYQGLIITRPLKLDMPDVLKTVPSIIQRGVFGYTIDQRNTYAGHVFGALYGSRDLINWHLVHSSIDHYIRGQHGTPYKYFRLALICNLADKESLFGCSMAVVPRDTNNLR